MSHAEPSRDPGLRAVEAALAGLVPVAPAVNRDRLLYEAGPDNNTTATSTVLRVEAAPHADLQVQSVTAPPTAQAGGTLDVQFTVISRCPPNPYIANSHVPDHHHPLVGPLHDINRFPA